MVKQLVKKKSKNLASKLKGIGILTGAVAATSIPILGGACLGYYNAHGIALGENGGTGNFIFPGVIGAFSYGILGSIACYDEEEEESRELDDDADIGDGGPSPSAIGAMMFGSIGAGTGMISYLAGYGAGCLTKYISS